MAADGYVAEGRADRRGLQGQGIRTISANVSGVRWCVLLTAVAAATYLRYSPGSIQGRAARDISPKYLKALIN